MVTCVGTSEGHNGWRKEHGLIIRVGDEDANPLIPQSREARGDNRGGVDVQRREHDGDHADGPKHVHRAPAHSTRGEEGERGDARFCELQFNR